MAIATDIVLADAQATPVNHTFVPQGRDKDGFYYFEDQSAPSPLGWWKFGIALTKPVPTAAGASADGAAARVKVKILLPVLESLGTNDAGLTPPPTIAYVPAFHGEFISSMRAGSLDRKNVRKLAYNLLGNAQVIAVVENLTNFSG